MNILSKLTKSLTKDLGDDFINQLVGKYGDDVVYNIMGKPGHAVGAYEAVKKMSNRDILNLRDDVIGLMSNKAVPRKTRLKIAEQVPIATRVQSDSRIVDDLLLDKYSARPKSYAISTIGENGNKAIDYYGRDVFTKKGSSSPQIQLVNMGSVGDKTIAFGDGDIGTPMLGLSDFMNSRSVDNFTDHMTRHLNNKSKVMKIDMNPSRQKISADVWRKRLQGGYGSGGYDELVSSIGVDDLSGLVLDTHNFSTGGQDVLSKAVRSGKNKPSVYGYKPVDGANGLVASNRLLDLIVDRSAKKGGRDWLNNTLPAIVGGVGAGSILAGLLSNNQDNENFL